MIPTTAGLTSLQRVNAPALQGPYSYVILSSHNLHLIDQSILYPAASPIKIPEPIGTNSPGILSTILPGESLITLRLFARIY